MLVTIDRLNLEFNEDIESMQKDLAELKRLEKAIEGSVHYNLLAGKTQMLAKGKGVTKKERSRLIHTNSIAYSIVEKMIRKIYDKVLEKYPDFDSEEYRTMFELNKEIAVKRGIIMAKAHDIGHVAFGHQGENSINDFVSQITDYDEINAILAEHKKYFGEEYEIEQGHINIVDAYEDSLMPLPVASLSFEHNELSAILLNQIMEKNGITFSNEGEVRKLTLGVLGHSTSRTPMQLLENDLIAQIVRVADKVEYINLDYDEISSLLRVSPHIESELISYLSKGAPERMQKTMDDLVEEALNLGVVCEGSDTMKKLFKIRKLYENMVYMYDGSYAYSKLKELLAISDDPIALEKYYAQNKGVKALYPPEIVAMLKEDTEVLKSAEPSSLRYDDAKQRILAEQVYFKSVMQGENSDRIYYIYQRLLQYYYTYPEQIPNEITTTINPIDIVQSKQITYSLDSDYTNLQRVLEFISLMDDETVMQQYRTLVEERIEKGPGFGIEPVRMDEIKSYLKTKYDEEAQKLVIKENIGTRSYEEARILYSRRSREFFANSLTEEGKIAMKRHYQVRFQEYAEDLEYLERMLRADEEREKKMPPQERIHPEGIEGQITKKVEIREDEQK